MNGQQPPTGGPAPGQAMRGAPLEPHRGVLILVFGICGFAVCAVFGIAAWIMGNGDLKKIKAGTMDPAGLSNTRTGRLLGIISTIFSVVVFGLTVLGMVFFLLVQTSSHHEAARPTPTQQAPAEVVPVTRPPAPRPSPLPLP
jgi:hypothetical protein